MVLVSCGCQRRFSPKPSKPGTLVVEFYMETLLSRWHSMMLDVT